MIDTYEYTVVIMGVNQAPKKKNEDEDFWRRVVGWVVETTSGEVLPSATYFHTPKKGSEAKTAE